MPRALPIFTDDTADTLDAIQIASPCHVEWSDMVGSDKVRFCGACQKNVFNLSGMKRAEGVELLRATEGRVCVRFYRRHDGTVLTDDCPEGVALLLRRAKRATLLATATSLGCVAATLALFAGAFGGGLGARMGQACTRVEEVKAHVEGLTPPSPDDERRDVKGDVAPLMGEAPAPDELRATAGTPLPVRMGKVARPTK